MKILERYIIKNVIATTLIVMVALLGVDLFFYTVNEIRYIGKGLYTLDLMLLFLLLKIPTKLYTMFPWAVVLGTLLALGGMAKHSELVAMQVASISIKKIALVTIKGIFLLTIVMFFFGEYVSPKTENIAQSKKTEAISGGQTMQTEHGLWVRNENEFVHIDRIYSDNQLSDITRYSFDDKQNLKEVTHSKSAKFDGEKWLLNDVIGTKFSDNKTEQIKEDTLVLDNLLDNEILETSGVKYLDRLSIANLYGAIKMRKENELTAKDYEIAFWKKIFNPFLILILSFVVVPFVFGPLRSSSIGLKVLIGAIVGFSFHTLNTVFAPLIIVANLPAILAVIIPGAIFIWFGMWGMNRVKG